MQLDLNHFVSDVDTDVMQKDEVPTIAVSPKQSLLFRCQIEAYYGPFADWKKDGKVITSHCSSTVKEVHRCFYFLALHVRKQGK